MLGDSIEPETIERLVKQADGNAFYLEELIRAVAEGKESALPETVLAMVKQLRKGIDAQTAREMNAKLQAIEGDADQLELDRLRDLFQGDYDPKQVVFLHDLYGLLEKVIDRCRDAGNIILQVALKYS